MGYLTGFLAFCLALLGAFAKLTNDGRSRYKVKRPTIWGIVAMLLLCGTLSAALFTECQAKKKQNEEKADRLRMKAERDDAREEREQANRARETTKRDLERVQKTIEEVRKDLSELLGERESLVTHVRQLLEDDALNRQIRGNRDLEKKTDELTRRFAIPFPQPKRVEPQTTLNCKNVTPVFKGELPDTKKYVLHTRCVIPKGAFAIEARLTLESLSPHDPPRDAVAYFRLVEVKQVNAENYKDYDERTAMWTEAEAKRRVAFWKRAISQDTAQTRLFAILYTNRNKTSPAKVSTATITVTRAP